MIPPLNNWRDAWASFYGRHELGGAYMPPVPDSESAIKALRLADDMKQETPIGVLGTGSVEEIYRDYSRRLLYEGGQ